jgi:hypothetical protein
MIHFARHLHGFIYAESLQGLNVKNTIVEITVSAFFAVNTLPLTKHLSSHDVHHIPAPQARKTDPLIKCRGLLLKKCELKNRANNVVSEMMPLDQFYVNTSI